MIEHLLQTMNMGCRYNKKEHKLIAVFLLV